MLNNVPIAIKNACRQVVLRHPNSMDCWVWRKQVTRVENDPDTGLPSTMGGSPTLGGMGVLRSEDEADYDYVMLGEGKCMALGPYQPNDEVERGNALLQATQQEAQVVSLAGEGEPGHFIPDTGDMVMVTPGLAVVLVYDVATITGLANIPPYIQKLVLNPRDDLHSLTPFLPGP
nr:hypothetical protein [uncultured Rhodoferax sp.]